METRNRSKNITIICLSALSAALLTVVAVFAFQPSNSASADPTPRPTATPAPAPATPDPASTPTPAVARCTVNSLKVTLGPGEGTAGSAVYPLYFTNIGQTPCELHGFPGVSMVGDRNGTQVGAPASWNSARPITQNNLQPGQSVSSALTVEFAQNVGGCTPSAVDGLRVYPPHSYDAVFVPVPGLSGCTQPGISLMSVLAVGPS